MLIVIVHRTTYNLLFSSLIIEKCIFQFDVSSHMDKVSSLCILPIFPYENQVNLLLIINKEPIYNSVLEFLHIQLLRYCGRLSYILHIAGIIVTGPHPHFETTRVFCTAKFNTLFYSNPRIYDIFPKFCEIGRIRRMTSNRKSWSSYTTYVFLVTKTFFSKEKEKPNKDDQRKEKRKNRLPKNNTTNNNLQKNNKQPMQTKYQIPYF
jgi:hypothetical protein